MKGLSAALVLLAALVGVFFVLVLAFSFWIVLGWGMGEVIDWMLSGYLSSLMNSLTGANLDGGDYGLMMGAAMGFISLAAGILRMGSKP